MMATPVRPGRAPVTLSDARDRIAAWEDDVRAWADLDPAAQATSSGPLAGWPAGVKDLFDAAGLPTSAGAARPSLAPAKADAVAVRRLREAGAVVLGKTEAVEYGWFGDVLTRNPWDLERSPGGSSSGSAAAVAAGMCRVALGTQTAGSVIRPAAYCGVVGLKLTHGAVDTTGMVAVSATLDSVGVLAGTVADAAAAAQVIADEQARARWAEIPARSGPLRLGVIEEHFRARTDDAVLDVLDDVLARLADWGVLVETVAPAVDWEDLAAAHRTIMAREMAAARAERLAADPEHFSPALQEAVAAGARISDAELAGALERRAAAQSTLEAAAAEVDAWVTPGATSLAPPAGQPGDPAASVPFTLVGFPALNVPAGLGEAGLPVGLQLVAPRWHDMALLDAAAAIEEVMR